MTSAVIVAAFRTQLSARRPKIRNDMENRRARVAPSCASTSRRERIPSSYSSYAAEWSVRDLVAVLGSMRTYFPIFFMMSSMSASRFRKSAALSMLGLMRSADAISFRASRRYWRLLSRLNNRV